MTHDVAMETESQFLLLGNVFLCTVSGLQHFCNVICDSNVSVELNRFLPGKLQYI